MAALTEQELQTEYEEWLSRYDEQLDTWYGSIHLNGLKEEHAAKLAQLLSNQQDQIERARRDGIKFGSLEETAVYIVEKVFRKHFEDDLVDIQPMKLPADLIYFSQAEVDENGRMLSSISTYPITANTRKLKCRVPSGLEDLQLCHASIDLEEEEITIVSDQIHLEQKMEILSDMRTASMQKNCSQTDLEKIIDELLNEETDGVKSNFVVTSPEVGQILQSLSLPIRVDIDPFYPRNQALFGHRSNNFGRGYVYAPYAPFLVTPTIYDAKNFSPSRRLMTRYGKQLLDKRLYTTLKIDDLAF